jgi:hypothetical protein
MFKGPDCAVPNVFRKVSGVREDLRFRNLREASFRVDAEKDTIVSNERWHGGRQERVITAL